MNGVEPYAWLSGDVDRKTRREISDLAPQVRYKVWD